MHRPHVISHHKKPAALRRVHRMMDEVYREMYQLEAGHPGAEMGLALALLRAHHAADMDTEEREEWEWLKTVSPLCLKMIEEALESGAAMASMLRCSSAAGQDS